MILQCDGKSDHPDGLEYKCIAYRLAIFLFRHSNTGACPDFGIQRCSWQERRRGMISLFLNNKYHIYYFVSFQYRNFVKHQSLPKRILCSKLHVKSSSVQIHNTAGIL